MISQHGNLDTSRASGRRLPIGAEVVPSGVHFRVWAPDCRRVQVVLEEQPSDVLSYELRAEPNGYFSAGVDEARDGSRYRFRLDRKDGLFPDPASRFQPQGPFGPSQVVNPDLFPWTDHGWKGIGLEGQVLYEMHIGTFTPDGTWESAASQLPLLAETGITLVELMPVADFTGRFGWGYDGVDLFAPTRLYGAPDDFRRFVDRAHSLGIAVLLDVVYNHFGVSGNFIGEFSKKFFSSNTTEWGAAINLDGENSGPVREFFISNALYWIQEFHLDGFRFDATQSIYDHSQEHLVPSIIRRVRQAVTNRSTVFVGENEPQQASQLRPPEKGGYGLDALWNDDFHHTAMVAMTGSRLGYYADYLGSPQEFISSFKRGYLFQGQRYLWQGKRRGTPALDIPLHKFIFYLQSHDQIANSLRGLRFHLLTSPGLYRAMTALLLLAPATPALFQGQEFASSHPFNYFCDISGELGARIYKGRIKFLIQFHNLAQPESQGMFPRPDDPKTFKSSKLDPSERNRHAAAYALHRDLLKLRRSDPVLGRDRRHGHLDGAVLGATSFCIRYFGDSIQDRLLLANLGTEIVLEPAPEPLLAAPERGAWEIIWSSEDTAYGGSGTPHPEAGGVWCLPGQAVVLLGAREAE